MCLCAVVRCARDAELSKCFVCRVASLVERCDTCLSSLSAWHLLVVSSGEVLLEFFPVGSGGSEVWDAEGFGVLSWRRPDSPLSHCLSLHWFRSHVVVSGVRPQLGQDAVLHVLCVSVAALSRPCAGAEAGARLASRACGLWVPLLAASGAVIACPCLVPVGVVGLALCRLVLPVVPAQCSLVSVVPFVGASLWWHRRVWLPDLAVYPGSGVVLLAGPRPCRGLRWLCLRCAEHCFRFVPNSVGFYGSHFLLLWPVRDW
ncbi:hypothetical protein Taro_003425 [Colocasia esculenta]|uniref:Uncharacterized protein n=1 Tax=Colocasia esculenta TaxID=4460 RepID=A0A843TJQ2_COLES|nr:hypothetical protein [Colocasia esculenta]